jgi:adenosylmethionine-8-amino-7-oxononanoate aminotransferase
MKDHERLPVIPIRLGEGIWLEDFDGRRYMDVVSSWWVNLFGHANPTINARIQTQLQKLEHVILAGYTHEPVIELSERLVNITPPGLNRVFYADNGSSAVEVALKMSFHSWRNQGHVNKHKFICLENSYHGETLGCLSVSDVALYKETYEPLLLQGLTVPSPDCLGIPKAQWANHSEAKLQALATALDAHHDTISAVIIEPLVQCAGGMRMHDPAYLIGLRELCDRYNVHFIADEIAVGFGRTGTLFACEQAKVTPDFMCLSKGLTGGYLPLSAVLTTDDIYECFYDDYQSLKAFLHSHSYTGNPIACAAALATLDIFENENIIEKNRILATAMAEAASPLIVHPHVAEVRQTGMIVAIELIKDKQTNMPYPWEERIGLSVYQEGLRRNTMLRPLGNVVYWMPPYVITPSEIQTLGKVTADSISLATGC